MRLGFWRRKLPTPKVPSGSVRVSEAKMTLSESMHLLTEYVLHMSITSLADGDITPLYEEYLGDPRLGFPEKEELTQAYLALQLRNVQSAADEPRPFRN
jgi:hypothetical protein